MANVSQSKIKSSKKDVNIMVSFHDRIRRAERAEGQLDSTEGEPEVPW